MNNEQNKRKKILQIYANSNLTNQQKQIEINKIMNPNSILFTQKNDIKQEKDIIIKSCEHYNRNCMIFADCCDKFYSCRLCHDENEDHPIDRYKIKTIICKKCKTIQDKSNKCIDCNIEFSDYFCNICNLWKDNLQSTFHCTKCNICRIGNSEDFIHCDNCSSCINKHFFEEHECIEDANKSNCPICNEYMFSSTKTSTILKCGHYMHLECFNQYINQQNYNCPFCKKSLFDMSNYWQNIDIHLENNIMPEEYKLWKTNISCNDCQKKSNVKFHFIYHKCSYCGGYNTDIINIIK
tara:strand:- start:378 stop:1262 length:885 start_codon:yes stop_codon:yes gene_type:complete